MKTNIVEDRIKKARKDPLYDMMISQMELNPSGAVVIDGETDQSSEEGKLKNEAWLRWQTYLVRADRRNTLKTWSGILSSGGKITLPCSNPGEMDPLNGRESNERSRYWDK